MKIGVCTLRKRFIGGFLLLGLLAIGSSAFEKEDNPLRGSGSYTFVSAAFTYDRSAPGILFTGSGKDNFGGAYIFQCVAELTPTATSCPAPDNTVGTKFDLVRSDCALTYRQGQMYLTAAGAAAGSQCVSNTTGSAGGNVNYTVTGGTHKLAGASGSFIVTFTNQTLAAPGAPPGDNGLFGAGRFTESGAVSK
jgi:hypothetical protein